MSLRQISVGLTLIVVLLLGCNNLNNEQSKGLMTLPYYGEPTFTPNWFEPNGEALKTFHKISPFQLINQDGKNIDHQSFENKIYITNYFFATCPGICPQMMGNLARVQDEFLNNDTIRIISHTAMPEKDSVSVLKKYAEAKGAISDKWHLVTGKRSHLYKLGRKDYFIEEDLGLEQEPDDFLHTENLVLIDKQKHIRGIYNGLNKTSVNQLIDDIKLLLKE